jgi:excisionase family DNA binding protein
MATAIKLDNPGRRTKFPVPIAGALLTVEETAALLRVPISWVYERTRRRTADRLPGIRLGKYWRFREADLLAWIECQRSGGRANA